jgi:hypothetical protein
VSGAVAGSVPIFLVVPGRAGLGNHDRELVAGNPVSSRVFLWHSIGNTGMRDVECRGYLLLLLLGKLDSALQAKDSLLCIAYPNFISAFSRFVAR